MNSTIDPTTRIGTVALSVADLRRSLAYYQHDIGLALLNQRDDQANLGVGSTALLQLHEIPGARLVRRATGLYHFALRVPTRRDLARVLRHFDERGTRVGGAADHLFSEALYLSDPDGHGIEIYSDRPRDFWYDPQGNLHVASDPLDLRDFLGELDGDESPWEGLPVGTAMGHIHLQVANIRDAERFYVDVLGFEPMIGMPMASFVSAGGYHHHIGMNTWAGIGVPFPSERVARLLNYEVVLDNQPALSAVINRIRAARVALTEDPEGWVVRDPSHNRILLRRSA
jgi:catechol 2,3-dioxygenase